MKSEKAPIPKGFQMKIQESKESKGAAEALLQLATKDEVIALLSNVFKALQAAAEEETK